MTIRSLDGHKGLFQAQPSMPVRMRPPWRALGAVVACAAPAIAVAGCGGSTSPTDAGRTASSAEPTPGPGAAAGGASGSRLVRRVAREDCNRAGPISASRVASNPKARRVGPVVFTPLALSRSIAPQPENIGGAPDARSIKIGATVISGGPTARVAISAPGGARLLYGSELFEALADKSLRWTALPRQVVFVRCANRDGGARTTAFPGGFVLRRAHTCVRLRVTDSRGRSATRSFPIGRGDCGEGSRPKRAPAIGY